MGEYIVYKHTAPNGKVYIGQTKKTIQDRWKNGKGYTCHRHGWFWKAIEKYGWDNIAHEILCDNLDKAEADYYEKYYIDHYQSTDKKYGYNCQSGGSRDYKYSEESKRNISAGLKQYYAVNGCPSTNKAREILQKKQGRQIVQYDLDGNKIEEYMSAYEAGQKTGIPHHKINATLCLPDRNKQAGGYMWRYKENAPERLEPLRKKRPCAQYDLKGNLIREWEDVKDADKAMSKHQKRNPIERCCDGKGFKTAYGFQWRFIDSNTQKIEAYNPYKKVIQYDLNGELLKVWDNAVTIKKELGWDIKNCCEGAAKTSHGYQWRYENDNTPLYTIKKPHKVNKEIEQYSLDGELIAVFSTTREASAHTGIRTATIQMCASRRRKTAGGFVWKYAEDQRNVIPVSHKRYIKVVKIDALGECIRKYKTIADAAHDNNISPSALSHYLSGAQKTLKCEEGIDFIREVQYAEK
jgi:group I intron endonuclease